MHNTRESSSRVASMAAAFNGVNLSAYARAEAKAQMRRAETMIEFAESLVRSIHKALIRFGAQNTAWRLKSEARLG